MISKKVEFNRDKLDTLLNYLKDGGLDKLLTEF